MEHVFEQLADKVAAAGYYVEQAVDFAKQVIQALKEKGVTKIGAAGFCCGTKVVVELAKDGEIQFAALLHPSFVTLDDIKGVKVPIGILGAEIDKRSPPELVKEFKAALLCHILFFNR
ncbi:putative dienelactone hydrolase, alpha/Beta hydrolase [Helianthus annuus]|nr:putative dienelactone hydrolase, alpha/Beta hydrolase [Helianthus annuus]